MSGDLTSRGNPAGYTDLAAWLTKELFPITGLTPAVCVICPGNHDIDRKLAKSIIGRAASDREADDLLEPAGLADGHARPFRAFEQFAKDFGIVAPKFQNEDNYLCGLRHFEAFHLRFACANPSWLCRDSNTDEGQLWLGLPLLRQMGLGDPDDYDSSPVTLAVIHHPRDFLHNSDRCQYDHRMGAHNYLALRVHAILCGHTHARIAQPEPDRFQGRAWHLQAGATFDSHQYRNNFVLVRIEDRHLTRRVWEYDPGDITWNERPAQKLSLLASRSSRATEPGATVYLQDLPTRSRFMDLLALVDAKEIPKPAEMDDLYARLMVQGGDHGSNLEPAARPLPLDEAVQQHRRLLIVGDAGSGKSTFLRRVAWALCREGRDPLLHLPGLSFPVLVAVSELDRHILETAPAHGLAEPDDPAWIAHFMAHRAQRIGRERVSGGGVGAGAGASTQEVELTLATAAVELTGIVQGAEEFVMPVEIRQAIPPDIARRLVEFGATSELFMSPKKKDTEDYITGRFG